MFLTSESGVDARRIDDRRGFMATKWPTSAGLLIGWSVLEKRFTEGEL